MSSLAADFQFLQTTLANDATLLGLLPGGVHQTKAPVKTTQPYGLFAVSSPVNVLSMTAARIYSPNLFIVKAVGPATSDSALHSANDRIATLLDVRNITVSAGIILACYQENPFYFSELVNGELWLHIGGLYRLQTK